MNFYRFPRSATFLLLTLLLMVLPACGSDDATPSPAQTSVVAVATENPDFTAQTAVPEPTETDVPPTATPSRTPEPTSVPEPTETPAPTATATRTPFEDAELATVRIVPQGSEYLEGLIGEGTGIIYDSSGLLLTSNHLVDGAGLVQVFMEGQEESMTAQVVGRSACDDVAVLKLLGSDFTAISIGSMDSLEEEVQIIGYPEGDSEQMIEETTLLDLEPSDTLITAGFSAVTGTLELDTVLDSGFSGAPMLTGDGRFTGLVTFPGNGDIPAAVLPLATLRPILSILEQGNNLNWIGLNTGLLNAEAAEALDVEIEPGLFVYAVDFRGPGGTADVRNGDVITAIGGNDITGEDGFEVYCAALRNYSEGDTLDITVLRSGNRYLGQLNGDPLAEEVVVVEAPPAEEGTGATEPPAGGASETLLANMQNTEANIRSLGGTIDSLATNGCLNPPLVEAGPGDVPGAAGPSAEIQAHPGCIHSISDCQIILDRFALIANPPSVDLTNASQEVVSANASHQAAIDEFVSGSVSLVEACRSFVNDPSLTISPLAFGLARQGVDDALAILLPAIQSLQG